MTIKWMDELVIGIKELDDQHRELFRRITRLLDAMREGKGREAISDTLDYLAEYVEVHFATEERYMNTYHYEKMQLHQDFHKQFRGNLADLRRRLNEKGPLSTLALDTQTLVLDWWKSHILEKDTVLAGFLKERLADKKSA